jgi:hypothetical protein
MRVFALEDGERTRLKRTAASQGMDLTLAALHQLDGFVSLTIMNDL